MITQIFQKLIYLHLLTDCSMKFSTQSPEQIQFNYQAELSEPHLELLNGPTCLSFTGILGEPPLSGVFVAQPISLSKRLYKSKFTTFSRSFFM